MKETKKRYFLLVAAPARAGRYKSLFFEEYEQPVYLHRSGTTGAGDPGTEAFSVTFCIQCNQGQDFYWDKKTGRFRQEAWKEKTRHFKKEVTQPAKDVPPEIVDKALQVAGKEPEVIKFTSDMKKANKPFGVRVEVPEKQASPDLYEVRIYEKNGNQEKLHEVLTVDIKKMAVVKKGSGK